MINTIAFHSNQLSMTGTEVALYDYAVNNEIILNNKSIVLYDINSKSNSADAVEKFRNRFDVFGYESKHEIEYLLQSDTENKYWHLTMKELKAYERPYCLDSAEIDAHRQRIAEEERHAKSVSQTQLMNYSWTMG